MAVDAGGALAMAEDARRNRALRGDAATVLEDRDELLLVDGDGDRLAQLARPLGGRRVAPPTSGSSQLKPMYMLEVATEVVSTMPCAFMPSDSVISPAGPAPPDRRSRRKCPMHRSSPAGTCSSRDLLLLAGEHHLVDEGQHLPAILQQAGLPVARLALAGIGLAMEVRIPLQHHARVGIVLGQHVGAGADRVPVQRQVLLGHAGLAVELSASQGMGAKKGMASQ
jgi:hypothetical protein